MNIIYGEKETAYLAARDKRLGAAIAQIGRVERAADPDVFASVVHHIIGQQISTAAQATVWRRLQDAVGTVDAQSLLALDRTQLQALGMTFQKANNILDFAGRVDRGEFDIAALETMPDDAAIRALTQLRGVGVWTAEMILTFCMQRPDVVSYGDLAIRRGMRMLYHRREIDRAAFDRYRRRYTPYGTVASLYLWAIAGGAIPELTDPAAPRGKK